MSGEIEKTFEIGRPVEQNLRSEPEDLRSRILARKNRIDSDFLEQAYDLYLVKNNQSYLKWDYESFDAYVIQELEMAQSTAMELIRVWKKFRFELSLQEDEIRGLGFSKAQLLTPIINKKTASEWIEHAKSKKHKDLVSDIKTWKALNPKLEAVEERSPEALKALEILKNNDLSSPSVLAKLPKQETLIKKSFFFYPSQLDLVNSVVNEESAKTDSVKQGHNLVCALMELLVARGQFGDKNEKKPHTILGLFESAFGGKVIWFKSDEQIKLIEKIMQENPDAFEKEGSNG